MMKAICNKREPGGILRCELPGGHDKGPRATPHQSEDKTWGAHNPNLSSSLLRSEIKRGKGIKQRSEKGDERNGWLQAILYAKLVAQHERWFAALQEGHDPRDARPHYCESCGTHISDNIEEALSILQPGHIEERRHDPGKGVRFGSGGKVTRIGTDSWDNIIPQCPSCNREQHLAERSDPEFGASA